MWISSFEVAEHTLREKGGSRWIKLLNPLWDMLQIVRVRPHILTITAIMMKIKHQQFPSTTKHKFCIHKIWETKNIIFLYRIIFIFDMQRHWQNLFVLLCPVNSRSAFKELTDIIKNTVTQLHYNNVLYMFNALQAFALVL
jgi:hypothetical protein